MASDDDLRVVCVPMKLDAFVFNEAVFNGQARVAPLSQPDYQIPVSSQQGATDKTPHLSMPCHDILPPVDLSCSSPAEINPRIRNLTTNTVRKSRFGVYLSWCLPKPFRSGYAATASTEKRTSSPSPVPPGTGNASTPHYLSVPNRYIIVRQMANMGPRDNLRKNTRVFVVESDLLRQGSDFDITEDIENEVTPFLDPNVPLNQQGNSYLGYSTTDMSSYAERVRNIAKGATKPRRQIPLTVVSSSNPLFADYQPHHSGVFSIHDDMSDVGPCKVSYFVMGYYGTDTKDATLQDPLASFGNTGDTIVGKDLLSQFQMRAKLCSTDSDNKADRDNDDLGQWKKRTEGPLQVQTICHGSLYGVDYTDNKAPDLWPAELAMTLLHRANPIAVGCTPVDALVAMLRAAASHMSNEQERNSASLLLRKAECFLINSSDDVDSQFEAADLLDTHNFIPQGAGKTWHFKNSSGSPSRADPSGPQIQEYVQLNDTQRLLDQLMRERQHLQHLLFCLYWKAWSIKASATDNVIPSTTQQALQASVTRLVERIQSINLTINTSTPRVVSSAKAAGFEQGTAEPFHLQKDPVVAFAGLPTGWPDGWEDPVAVRVKRLNRGPGFTRRVGSFEWAMADFWHLENLVRDIGAFEHVLSRTINQSLSEQDPYNVVAIAYDNLRNLVKSTWATMERLVSSAIEARLHPPYVYPEWQRKPIKASNAEIAHLYLIGWYAAMGKDPKALLRFHDPSYRQPPATRDFPIIRDKILKPLCEALQRAQLACNVRIALAPDDLDATKFSLRDPILRGSGDTADLTLYSQFVEIVHYEQRSDQFGNVGAQWTVMANPATAVMDPWDLDKRTQLLRSEEQVSKDILSALSGTSDNTELQSAFADLFMEWMCLHSGLDCGRNTPAYYMEHDRWLGQAWFPIYVEWELEYYHLPWEDWTFGPTGPEQRVRYSIRSDINLSANPLNRNDVHVISGRSPVLPQVAGQIKTLLQRFLKTMHPKDLPDGSAEKAYEPIHKLLNNLPFMSAAMNGLTDHLLTLQNGPHVKPLNRQQGQPSQPMPGWSGIVSEVGFTDEVLKLMGTRTGRTPFAEATGGSQPGIPSFKPVTHGQARFTKLTIVDKFGQAVPCLDPAHSATSSSIAPITSEYMLCASIGPDASGNYRPNTILDQHDHCEFFQIPPRINQSARWNADHLVCDKESHIWRPTTEWENPVVCVIVINYCNKSLQIFDNEGEFVAEYAVGSASGGSGVRSRPFAPRKVSEPRLSAFLSRLSDALYIKEVYSMIELATGNLPHAPTSYADALPAVLGRPIALTYTGWSLELADPPFASHAFTDMKLAVAKATDYEFPLKLGDKDASYDGLIGYFNVTDMQKQDAIATDMSIIKTHFGAMSDSKYLQPASASCSAFFHPHYIQATTTTTPSQLAESRAQVATKLGMFVDIFTPVWGYSGILPAKKLNLPAWTMERTLKQMTGFYRVGPLLVPNPIAPLLKDATKAQLAAREARKIQIPNDGLHDLAWLQPSWGQGPQTEGYEVGAGPTGKTFYEVMGLDQIDSLLGQREGPLSAVEGFLQLRKKDVAATTT